VKRAVPSLLKCTSQRMDELMLLPVR
jgi:hypothetical protein